MKNMMNKVWGWRGRVGLIMPATQTVTEPLFHAIAPEGISFHTSRLLITAASPGCAVETAAVGRIAETEKYVPRAIEELAQARVQCIAYMCVGGGLLRGRKAEEQFCAEVEQQTGIPVVSALLSVLEALRVLRLHKIVATDPYVKEFDELEEKFLQDNGFEVLGVHGLGMTDGFEFGQVVPQDIYAFSKKVWNPAADGLYIGCCAFNAMPVIELLETELHVPVVTAHAAVLWQILKILGIKEPLPGYGKLLTEYV